MCVCVCVCACVCVCVCVCVCWKYMVGLGCVWRGFWSNLLSGSKFHQLVTIWLLLPIWIITPLSEFSLTQYTHIITDIIIFYILACISSRLRYLTHGPSEKEGRETKTESGIETEKGTGIKKETGKGRSTMVCQRLTPILTEATSLLPR